MVRFALLLAAFLAACAPAPQAPPPRSAPVTLPADLPPPEVAAENFVAVVRRVEPVAEAICRETAPARNCDIRIVVDARRGLPPNAFHTIAEDGTPLVIFTISLIAEARNQDELAFIMGHEAAHYILGHIARAEARAAEGALMAGILGEITGADIATVRRMQRLAAEIRARSYSKAFELEADALGARIALAAGYDPIRGAEYFNRIPDPGNRLLATHPPNAARIEVVRRAVAAAAG
ncbi:MAG: peptidase M48 [Alphaproteobacteria bacterium]|nr:MAG: peptidase M48 [Alphaproteobacteria bacterium]